MTLHYIEADQSEQAIRDALARDAVEPLIITKRGKAVAALVPLDNFDLESASLSMNEDFMRLIEESRKSAKERGTVPFDEVKRLFA